MKVKIIAILLGTILLGSNTIGAKDETLVFPSALIRQPIYQFVPVVDGNEVVHDYIIQNKGTATLEIQKIKSD